MKLEVLNVDDWPLINEAVGEIVRHCAETETSFVIDGTGRVEVEDGEPVSFSAGDLVTVLPDTRCTWHITEAIERHYYKG